MKTLKTIIFLTLPCLFALADDPEIHSPKSKALEIKAISIINESSKDFPDAPEILNRLLLGWKELYGERIALAYNLNSLDLTQVYIRIEYKAPRIRAQVTISTPGRDPVGLISVLSESGIKSLPSTLAGNIFYLWAMLNEFSLPVMQEPPRLTGVLNLETLFRDEVESTDCTAGPDGLVIAFTDRFIHLGLDLQMTPLTARELHSPVPMPSGFIPTNICLDPLAVPVLFSAGSGAAAFLNPLTGELEQVPTGVSHPVHFTVLPGGGFALLAGRRIRLFFRQDEKLMQRSISLPGSLFTMLSADQSGKLWVFDPVERRIRIFNRTGEEIRSIKPVLEPSLLVFPQVFQALADDSFLLGGPGELWRFTPQGLPLWRLTDLKTLYREAVPAFYKIAVSSCSASLFLLDPLTKRIFKFTETSGMGAGEPSELFSRLDPLKPDSMVKNIEEKKALCLAVLARKLQKKLLLPEADLAYGQSIAVYRKLRAEDPVNPLYPAVLRGLTARRSFLRAILYEERVLQCSVQPAAFSSTQDFRLFFINSSNEAVEQLRVTACLSGISACSEVSALIRLEAGAEEVIPLMLKAPEPAAGLKGFQEDLPLRLSVQASFRQDNKPKSLYFKFPVLLKKKEADSALLSSSQEAGICLYWLKRRGNQWKIERSVFFSGASPVNMRFHLSQPLP